MASRRYNNLINRIKFIENNLLPAIRMNGNYTKKESDLIRSYVLLVHAEIEAYFEDIATEKAKKSLDDWKTSRKKSNCLLSIIAFIGDELNWKNKPNIHELNARVNRVVSHYIISLNNNHGIKESNIFDILLPLGIEINQIDPTWLTTMDSFGSFRGKLAHTTHSVQAQIDLVTENNRINHQIIPEIEVLDDLIKRLK